MVPASTAVAAGCPSKRDASVVAICRRSRVTLPAALCLRLHLARLLPGVVKRWNWRGQLP